MDLGLTGTRALVTGASKGIGLAVARVLVAEGRAPTRAVLPGMLAAGRGAIVTIASVNAFLPDPAVIDYSAGTGSDFTIDGGLVATL